MAVDEMKSLRPLLLTRALVLLAITFSSLPAFSQACPDLKTKDNLAFPVGQYGATMTEPLPKVRAPDRHVAVPAGSLQTVRIKLERTECYGICPSYSV